MDAYLRISKDIAGEGIGVANQLAAIRKWAEDNGHSIGKVYQDNDISATTGRKRPDFEQMLKDKPKEIVVWHQDRLLRVSKDLERVIEAEMIVHQVVAGSFDLVTPQGRAMARTVTAWATNETEQKAQRQKLRNSSDAAKGKPYWRRRPFGHNLDGTLNEPEATALEHAAERIIDGASLAATCRELNDKGFQTTAGKPWIPATLKGALTSTRIIGKREYEGKLTDGAWTPILTEEKQAALLVELKTRERPRKSLNRENLLSGLGLCGECGSTVSQSQGAGREAAYRCSKSAHMSKVAASVEQHVEAQTMTLLGIPGAEAELNHSTGIDIGALRAARAKELDGWAQWQEEAAQEGLRPSEYRLPREAHLKRLAETDAEILKYEQSSLFAGVFDGITDPLTPEPIGRIRKIWTGIPLERKRRILRAVWASITLHSGKRGQPFNPETVVLVPTEDGERLQKRQYEFVKKALLES